MPEWLVFRGTREPHNGIDRLPPPPAWRAFDGPVEPRAAASLAWKAADLERAVSYETAPETLEIINAALFLRRPLLVTGKPGVGKSSLSLAVAHELELGPVLRWPITSRSVLSDGLYRYDALSRLQDVNLPETRTDIGDYLTLGPLGTALLPSERPRVLLVDELDKSDMDFPNDLLTVFEEGYYEIPELQRIARIQPEVTVATADPGETASVRSGRVQCAAFPLVVLTSNNEREFPPAFLRRCIQLHLEPPGPERLARIVAHRLGPDGARDSQALIRRFLDLQKERDLATDQLLNALYISLNIGATEGPARTKLAEQLFQQLQNTAEL
ncbi:MoxR family ATPase [Actinocorallia longicatena]